MNSQVLISKQFKWMALAILMTITACGPAMQQTASPAAASPSAAGKTTLLRAVDAYSAGSYGRVIALLDSLTPHIAPTDSQLNYLATYYSLKARAATGEDSGLLKYFLDNRLGLIPGNQHTELRLLAGEIAEESPGEPDLGPDVAYKIGVILPLSGQYSQFGEAILEGVRLAVDEYNRATGNNLELLVRDDAGEPVRAASMGRELASDSAVAALIGSHGNEASLSLALISAAQDIPLVCPTADAPGLDGIGNSIHVINRTDPRMSAAVARASVEMMRLHTFAVIAEDDERGNLLADGFIDSVTGAGGTVIADMRYPQDTTNFETQMSLIQRYLPDAVYITAKSDMITQLASQVHYYGMGDVQLIGGEYWDSERVIRMGGDYVDGGLFSSPFYVDSDLLQWQSFKTDYERVYRRPVYRFSAYGYDAVGLITASLQSVPTSRAGLALTLREGKQYGGATGLYTIGADGRVEREYFVLRLASGNIVPAEALVDQPDTNSELLPATDSTSISPE